MGHRIHEREEKGREENRRERERKKEQKRERIKDGGDFQHAPQPLVSSPPELKKGDRTRHMPGERERVPVVRLRVWVYGPAINAWRILVHACVRTLHAITASRTGGVDRRGRLYERQSDPGNLMRN